MRIQCSNVTRQLAGDLRDVERDQGVVMLRLHAVHCIFKYFAFHFLPKFKDSDLRICIIPQTEDRHIRKGKIEQTIIIAVSHHPVL